MIKIIEEALNKYGLIGKQSRYSYNVYRRGEIVYFLVVNNGAQFAVKVSKHKSFEGEFEATKEAFKAFNNCVSVPEPLFFSDEFGISLLISRGIRFTPITSVLSNRYLEVFKYGIYEYIDRSKEHFTNNLTDETHSAMVEKLRTYFYGTSISVLLPKWFDIVGEHTLNSFAHVKQHGDFVVTNVGISSKNLSVIDWEDYGKLTLPGIDVLTICASYLGMEETKIERLIYHKQPLNLSEIINYYCNVYGIRYELFKELAPLYFTSFLYLKKRYGYGKAIINKVENISLMLFNKVLKERQKHSK